jgi:hypothetical protein
LLSSNFTPRGCKLCQSFSSSSVSFSALSPLPETRSIRKPQCATVLDSSQNYQLPGFCYEMHKRQYIQLHT